MHNSPCSPRSLIFRSNSYSLPDVTVKLSDNLDGNVSHLRGMQPNSRSNLRVSFNTNLSRTYSRNSHILHVFAPVMLQRVASRAKHNRRRFLPLVIAVVLRRCSAPAATLRTVFIIQPALHHVVESTECCVAVPWCSAGTGSYVWI